MSWRVPTTRGYGAVSREVAWRRNAATVQVLSATARLMRFRALATAMRCIGTVIAAARACTAPRRRGQVTVREEVIPAVAAVMSVAGVAAAVWGVGAGGDDPSEARTMP